MSDKKNLVRIPHWDMYALVFNKDLHAYNIEVYSW